MTTINCAAQRTIIEIDRTVWDKRDNLTNHVVKESSYVRDTKRHLIIPESIHGRINDGQWLAHIIELHLEVRVGQIEFGELLIFLHA
jgi:hypothetical protein